MPRPQRPSRDRSWQRFWNDDELADKANLDVDSEAYRQLKTEVLRLIDRYDAAWRAGAGPGRLKHERRDTLIAGIAEAFQTHSGWSMRSRSDPDQPKAHYQQDYLKSLDAFLVIVLVSHQLLDIPARRPRLIPKAQRVPRP